MIRHLSNGMLVEAFIPAIHALLPSGALAADGGCFPFGLTVYTQFA